MVERSIRITLILCLPAIVLAPAATTEEISPRVFVLDAKTLTVTALALENGEVLGSATLQGKPESLAMSPNGTRLVALDKGKGKETMRYGYQPTERSWVSVIDAKTMEVLARLEVGWTVSTGFGLQGVGLGGEWSFSPDGRFLTIACLGYRSQEPRETLPAELVRIDLETGVITERLELERRIDGLLELPDEHTAILYSGYLPPMSRQPSLRAELAFIDLRTLQVLKTVPLDREPGLPVLSPDGEFLYLLEYGKPHKKPEKNINGRVQVVSLSDRAHEISLDAGSAPRGLIVDEQGLQVFVLSDGRPSREKKDKEDRRGLLHVIRAADTVATLEVGADPLFVRITPDRQWLYAVSEDSMTAVDLFALRESRPSELKQAGMSLWTAGSQKKTASEVVFTSDSKRAYVLYAESSKLGVYDLEQKKMLAELNTGRGGVKFAKFMGSVAASAGSYYAGYTRATATGSSIFIYTVYNVSPASTTMVFGQEERYVYVLNTHSNDVTIVDTRTQEEVNKVGVGGAARRLKLLPGGDFVAVTTGDQTLHLIDTTINQKIREAQVGGNYVMSPDEKFAVALGDKAVYLLEGSTLNTLASAGNFEKPIHLVFLPLPERDPATLNFPAWR